MVLMVAGGGSTRAYSLLWNSARTVPPMPVLAGDVMLARARTSERRARRLHLQTMLLLCVTAM
jgi:hypothetical protein